MTLAAPRSRQGKLLLVLAFLVVAAAAVGTFFWASNAQADISSTTVVLTSNQGATVNPGDHIIYTATVTQSGVPGGTVTNTKFTVTLDNPNIASVTFPAANNADTTPWVAAECAYTAGVVTCTDPLGPVNSDVVTIDAVVAAGGDNTVNPPSACNVTDDGTGQADCTFTIAAVPINGVTNSGNQTVIAGGSTIITFTVPIGLTYCSDTNADTARSFNNNPTTGDLVVVPATAVVLGPSATLNATTSTDTASVTVMASATVGAAVTATLSTHPATSDLTTDCTPSLVTITSAAPTGYLRHLDIPDAGTEDAAGTTIDSAGTPPCPGGTVSDALTQVLTGFLPSGVCGLLKNQDDIDDAQGSFHGACIEGSALTFLANNPQIAWSITPVAGGPLPASITPFAGPSGEPCVAWSAGSTGTQQITATWTSGTASVTFYFNGDCTATLGTCFSHPGTPATIDNPLPLIKEWNTIDSTRIVRPATGHLGSDPDVIAGNTGGAADWVQRNCSLLPLVPATPAPGGGDCILANLDSLTMPVEASLNPNGGSFIRAAGQTFIDYTMGHHADAGGSYTGPVDGASQTYCNGTLSGPDANGVFTCKATGSDCGTIRLENPHDGKIYDLQPGEMLTVPSSDKGVAFEFVPNDNGLPGTTIGNADCGPGATICVTIDTREANLFRSPPLLKAAQEKICVQFNIGPPTNKTPILAWAGQRVVLENYWGDPVARGALPAITGTVTFGTTTTLDDANAAFPTMGGGLNNRTLDYIDSAGVAQSTTITGNTATQLQFSAVVLAPKNGSAYTVVADPGDNPCREGDGGPVPNAAFGNSGRFGVQYSIQAGSGSFTGAPAGNTHDIDQTGHDAIVHVEPDAFLNAAGITDPNSNCTSRIIVESEDQTEMDVTSYIVGDNANVGSATPRSQQVAFVIYFMKFESQTLQLIPDNIPATDAWDKGGTPTVMDPATGVTPDLKTTVSDNVAAQVTVKGYVLTDNCPARDAKTAKGFDDGQLREFFPANRCIFPDDWAFKAGALSQTALCTGATAPVPQQCRPEMDIAGPTAYSSLCPGALIAGPFSLLDQITHAGLPVTCGDSLAPYPPADLGIANSRNCLTADLSYSCRDSNFPDGSITPLDAPMPPALVQFNLLGSGFLESTLTKAAAGASFTANGVSYPDSGFASAAIPAEPWITPFNADGEGYVWNTWGVGANSGLYNYWTSLADHGPEVISCATKSSGMFVNQLNPSGNPCVNDPAPIGLCQAAGVGSGCVRTGGYDMTEVYSDEHGVAMTLINGDANLNFSGCKTSAPVSGTTTPIVLLNGFYCAKGATVGTSSLIAAVDYPDKRKHFAEVTNTVTISWTWNGTKDVTVVPDPADTTGQFHYVVFHVTDRDGFCGTTDSLHPVLGEEVDFRIDSTTGTISPDVNGNSAEGPVAVVAADLKSATTHTFDSALPANALIKMPTLVTGECQAWIHVSESLLNQVDVIITAFDPEGTVTFDTRAINPTPVVTAAPPTPTAAPTPPPPTPVTLHLMWGNTDCSQDGITSRDAQAILKRVLEKTLLSVDPPCPAIGETVIIAGNTQHWGNWDCSTDGVTSRDAQADLKFVLQKTPLSQTQPCPLVGAAVDVQLVP